MLINAWQAHLVGVEAVKRSGDLVGVGGVEVLQRWGEHLRLDCGWLERHGGGGGEGRGEVGVLELRDGRRAGCGGRASPLLHSGVQRGTVITAVNRRI